MSEYRGVLADIEELPYMKQAGGAERGTAGVTLARARMLQLVLEWDILRLIQDFEREADLIVDTIALSRDEEHTVAVKAHALL
jgi:hypothetical protein